MTDQDIEYYRLITVAQALLMLIFALLVGIHARFYGW